MIHKGKKVKQRKQERLLALRVAFLSSLFFVRQLLLSAAKRTASLRTHRAMSTAYYHNPFEDDDDTCFADVEVEEIFIEETPARTEPTPEVVRMPARHQEVTARPGSNRDPYVRPARSESEDYSEEYVVTHSSHSTGTVQKSGRTKELRLDEMTQSLSQLRRQMNQVHSSKNTMEEDYEEHIRTLREDLDHVNEERNELLSMQSKLESELRSIRLERDNMAFLYKQEKERNEVLGEQVSHLQEELSEAQQTHQEMMEELHQTHQEELARSACNASPRGQNNTTEPHKIQRRKQPTLQRRNPYEQQYNSEEHEHIEEDGPPEQEVEQPPPPKQGAAREVKARGRGNPTASSWTIGEADVPAHIEKTEKEKEAERQKRVEEVERLEAQLLEHSRNKDELSSQLTRLENSRTRNAIERQKKNVVEGKLQEEEKAIGQIRLKLRSMEALFR